ncbi:unnamed protein product, partial [Choristocarpus tenellus]
QFELSGCQSILEDLCNCRDTNLLCVLANTRIPAIMRVHYGAQFSLPGSVPKMTLLDPIGNRVPHLRSRVVVSTLPTSTMLKLHRSLDDVDEGYREIDMGQEREQWDQERGMGRGG